MRLRSLGLAACCGLSPLSCGDDGSSGTAGSSGSSTSTSTSSTTDPGTSSTTDPGTGTTMTPPPLPECGNMMVEFPEECDDGNDMDGDDCNNDCTDNMSTADWSDAFGGMAAINDVGEDIATDAMGNVIVVGHQVDDPANRDAVIRKYDPAGAELWTVVVDGAMMDEDRAQGVGVDSMGNILVTGDQDLAANVSEIWVAKYDPMGMEIWSFLVPGTGGPDTGWDIGADSLDNVLVTGSVRTGQNDNDIWVGAYDPMGMELWTDTVMGPSTQDDQGRGIAADSMDDIVVAGFISNADGSKDVWFRKYDPMGAEVWTQTWTTPGMLDDAGHSLAIGPADEIVIGGFTQQTPNNDDLWLGRFMPDGTLDFVRDYGGPAVDDDLGFGVAVDSMGNMILGGFKTAGPSNWDMWLRKYEPSGNVTWTQVVIGMAGNRDQILGVTVDAMDNIFAVGEIRDISPMDSDIWVGKFNP